MTPFAIPFPNIDPVALDLGVFTVKWYGLAYVAGFLFGWLYVRRLVQQPHLWANNQPPFSADTVDDLLIYVTAGVIIGGRLGQVLLYDPGYYFANPAEIIKVWKGGMAFHGALVGSGLALLAFAHRYKVNVLSAMDVCSAAVPLGILFGRLANFINSEHWGRPTDVAWAMVFPNGGPEARHPSQLYEAALEGLVLLVITRILTHRAFALKRPGLVTGVFLVWYAIARTICEFYREPEKVHALNIEPMTAGQLYSLPMFLLGLAFIWWARRANLTKAPV